MRDTPALRACALFVLAACGHGEISPAATPAQIPTAAGESNNSRGLDDAGSPVAPNDVDGSVSAHAGSGRAHRQDPGRGIEDIRAIVVAHRDEARACYEKSLAAHPGMEGDLVMHWTIDPKGNVTEVASEAARSQIYDSSVIACVSSVLSKLQFAPSARGFETRAFYPFNFHPRRLVPNSQDNLRDY